MDRNARSEGAEGREDEDLRDRLIPEAGGAQGPAGGGAQGGGGMEMAADGDGRRAAGMGGVVDEMEGNLVQDVAGELDTAGGRGEGAATVVVAGDEGEGDVRMGGAPGGDEFEDGGGLRGGGVEEIAAEDDVAGSGALDSHGKAGEVVGGVSFGDGQTVVTEVRRFAEMEIGEEERAGFLPKGAAFGKELEGLTAESQGGVREHQRERLCRLRSGRGRSRSEGWRFSGRLRTRWGGRATA